MMTKRVRRAFSKEFKNQTVQLHSTGKPRSEFIKEYGLTPSAFDKRIRQQQETGSFDKKDSRTPEQEEIVRQLQRENQNSQWKMIFKSKSR